MSDAAKSSLPQVSDISPEALDSLLNLIQAGDTSDMRIGRFLLLKKLGEGGMGQVWLAEDPKLNRLVALKRPNRHLIESESATRFQREARAIGQLQHRHIVVAFEADEADGALYLTMEYCKGGSLSAWLKRNPDPVDLRDAASLVADIADAIAYAHSHPIIHRDLKPSNILLDGDPQCDRLRDCIAKVSDFGLALLFDSEQSRNTRTGARLGSPAYMAPEQSRGDRQAIGPATDVYGLGGILRELLIRRSTHENRNSDGGLPSMRLERPEIPEPLDRIVRRCLEDDPAHRYPDARSLAADLHRFLQGAPISPAWRWSLRRARRRILHPPTIAAMAVGSLIFPIGFLATWNDEPSAPPTAPTPGNLMLDDLIRRYLPASARELPDLIKTIDPSDPYVARWLIRAATEKGADSQARRNAVIALAKLSEEWRTLAIKELWQADLSHLEPLSRALLWGVPDLMSRLESVATSEPSSPGDQEAIETHDDQRTRAATALALLGEPRSAWRLFAAHPASSPQTRSFLIHALGPAGVDPEVLRARLEAENALKAETADVAVQRALILALGEIPNAAWSPAERERTTKLLWSIYKNSPDSGVHGAAKWLLVLWSRDVNRDDAETLKNDLRNADVELAQRQAGQGPWRWRVTKTGLTLIRVDLSEFEPAVEISDTEIPLRLFRDFRSNHSQYEKLGKAEDCPVNNITDAMVADFCGKLSAADGISGYRLMMDHEFQVAARAGTNSKRYFGDSLRFFDRYVRSQVRNQTRDSQTLPIGSLKPNDLGFFDLLGNASELTSLKTQTNREGKWRIWGGSSNLNEDYATPNQPYKNYSTIETISRFIGFRIARTVKEN